jgi:hypothetical protein
MQIQESDRRLSFQRNMPLMAWITALDNLMKIPLIDRGAYYRGLLVLIRRDHVIDSQERELMIQFGQKLDFDRRFCEAAIDDLLKNPHIKDSPMKFSDRKTAEFFLRDAILLAFVDDELHSRELAWLKEVAKENGIDDEWLKTQLSGLDRLPGSAATN